MTYTQNPVYHASAYYFPRNYPFSVLASMCLITFSCNDDPALELNYENVESEFGEPVASFSLGNESNVKELIAHDNNFLYSVFGSELRYHDTEEGRETLWLSDVQINKLVNIGGGVAYVCAWNGVYRFTFEDNQLSREVACNCSDIELYEGEVYYTRIDDEDRYPHIGLIFHLNGDTSIAINENYRPGLVYDFAISPDGDFFFIDENDKSITRLDRNDQTIEVFTSDNAPIQGANFGGRWWSVNYDDYLIFVEESGTVSPTVIAWSVSEQSWIDLFPEDLMLFEDNYSKWGDMNGPSYTEVVVHENHLLISTMFAGCKGVQYWNISPVEEFEPDDYQAFRFTDENLNCVQGITTDHASDDLVLYTQQGLVTYFD